jgi:DNA polymerase-3 subunit epsilon
MKSIWEIPFIVVDVETSGAHPQNDRITEIACVTTIGGEITDTFSSLINPHQPIPYFISTMTGITNEMVFNAPELDEIMPKVEAIFNQTNAVFVAHNARFDWSFVLESFNLAGLRQPKLPRICTLKLSRRLLQKSLKKNVGSLSNFFDIQIIDRHRAGGDATATAHILNELMALAELEHDIEDIDQLLHFQNKPIKNFRTPSVSYNRVETKLDELPDEPGVYHFLGEDGSILYIGKAKSLKDRVKSYFNQEMMTSKKITEMIRLIHDIRWLTTDTELLALLLESKSIKTHRPHYNTADKVYGQYPFIRITTFEEFPIADLTFNVRNDGSEYYGPFNSISFAHELILTIEKQFKLRKCKDDFSVSADNKPCFYHQIKRCDAPCAILTTKSQYDEEVEKVRLFLSGCSDGVITQLEKKMLEFSEKLEYEKAYNLNVQIKELKKLFGRKYISNNSIASNNMIFFIPNSPKERLFELYVINSGKLVHNQIIGRKAPIDDLFSIIQNEFFLPNKSQSELTEEDIDEIWIINSYIYKRRNTGKFIYLNGQSESDFYNEIQSEIRNYIFEDEINDSTEFIDA